MLFFLPSCIKWNASVVPHEIFNDNTRIYTNTHALSLSLTWHLWVFSGSNVHQFDLWRVYKCNAFVFLLLGMVGVHFACKWLYAIHSKRAIAPLLLNSSLINQSTIALIKFFMMTTIIYIVSNWQLRLRGYGRRWRERGGEGARVTRVCTVYTFIRYTTHSLMNSLNEAIWIIKLMVHVVSICSKFFWELFHSGFSCVDVIW